MPVDLLGCATPAEQPQRRFLSLSLPLLPTDRIARQRWGARWRLAAASQAAPLVVVGERSNAMRLVALDETATRAGLFAGQSLTDARAILPSLDVCPEDPRADTLLLEAVADWCDRYTPLVAIDRSQAENGGHAGSGLMLDIAGCAHLFGGEQALARDLLARLFAQGFLASAAIAATPGAAWALARFGRTENARFGQAGHAQAGTFHATALMQGGEREAL